MFLKSRQRVLFGQTNGSDRKITVAQAQEKIRCGVARYSGEKEGLPYVIEETQAIYRDRAADLWVKDRGVKGGKYGRPYEPNGHTLPDGLFCGGAQFHLAHQ